MEYARLGFTGLKVSRICLGCMSFGTQRRDWMIGEEPEPRHRQARARRRHQFLRHRGRLFARRERGNRTGRALKNLGVPRDQSS